MIQPNLHRVEKQVDLQDTTDTAQGVNRADCEVLDEDALDQIAGGQAIVTKTSGWKPIYPGMTISPDGKSFTYHGAVLPNNVEHLA